MKKLFIGALIAISAVSFVACGNNTEAVNQPTIIEEAPEEVKEAPAEQVPMDDEVTTLDDNVFSADIMARADLGASYSNEISDLCNQVGANPYTAPSYADTFYGYADKFMALEYTEEEMAMMTGEQAGIAQTWNVAINYMETACRLLGDGCATYDEESINLASYYMDLAADTLYSIYE